MEMHLFDGNARDEEALCGADTSAECRMGVDYYLACRRGGAPVGTVCEECKTLIAPFADNRVRDLEADGDADKAEEFRRLAGTLARETGQDRSGDWETRPCTAMYGAFLRFRPGTASVSEEVAESQVVGEVL